VVCNNFIVVCWESESGGIIIPETSVCARGEGYRISRLNNSAII